MRLPVFEEDEDPGRRDELTAEEAYERRAPPTSIVVRYGYMQMVAEYPYDGPAKPGCGSKLVARTSRGLEVVEMLTTTCPNAGCGKAVSRNEMLEYIENSGGSEYPFRTDGKILRVATIDDLNRWGSIKAEARDRVRSVKVAITDLGLEEELRLIELEPILSQEQLAVYYTAEDRVDFRELVQWLAREFTCRIEMRQVGARDEARLVADYERCGQHCCCQNFLKVLKPVSMRSAKVQKATLDPLKISGRCGRLMCCLRYEDETYSELKSRLPHKKTRVGTPEGPGLVIDSKILVQLVLVCLERDNREIAVPVEELCDPDACPKPGVDISSDPLRGMPADVIADRTDGKTQKRRRRRRRGRDEKDVQQDAYRQAAQAEERAPGTGVESDALAPEVGEPTGTPKKKRRRRRRKRSDHGDAQQEGSAQTGSQEPGSSEQSSPKTKKRRRRRRRRGSRRDDGGGGEGGSTPGVEG